MKPWLCLICEKPIPDYEPEYCCTGLSNECYCLGLPTHPPVCSSVCYDALIDGIGKPIDERRKAAGIKLFQHEPNIAAADEEYERRANS